MDQIQVLNSKETCTAWYGWIRDDDVRRDSTSGGAFTAIAELVLAQGGVVIGAYYDADENAVKHGSSDNVSLASMRKSKYVESDMSQALPLIYDALSNNRMVLFCGTPCQCAGVRKLFGYRKGLILCDFFCHGVPSGKLFKDFLELKEYKKKSKITDYQFRTKDFGWSQCGIRTFYENGKVEKTVGRCEFFYAATMIDDYFLRKSCYMCDKSMYHVSDFTIGDFWGINKLDASKNDNRGISVLIANTSYGNELIPQFNDSIELYPLEKHYLDYAFKVKTADKKIECRDNFFDEYKKIGIRAFINKYYRKRLVLSKAVFTMKRIKLKMGE